MGAALREHPSGAPLFTSKETEAGRLSELPRSRYSKRRLLNDSSEWTVGHPFNHTYGTPAIFSSAKLGGEKNHDFVLFVFWLRRAHGILVPQSGMELAPPALEAES